jgi:acyl-CoA synthetase (AMP-forming)/AMP-acid ligase II
MTCPEYPPAVRDLLGVLTHQHATMPGRPMCHRIVRDRAGLRAEPMTVAELAERAAGAAAALHARGVRAGDRVVISLSDPHDFLVAFFGALGAGAAAVPLPTAGELGAPRSFAARVRSVCADCAPAAAVVEGIDAFVRAAGELPSGMALVEPGALAGAGTAPLATEAVAPAFIQYTSGSTGTPKGVVVTHANVLANCRAIRDATAYTRADRMVSWLPLHHDMGLVGGLLTSIYCAAETWLMPPMAFLARPVTWLEAMTAFKATLTVGPTFAYALCARKIPDKQLAGIDLSRLRLAYVGAEPVDAATLEAFVTRFSAHGLSAAAMYPVYGLAEATLAAAFPEPGAGPRLDTVDRRRLAADGVALPAPASEATAVTLVSVGRALPRHRVTIVSPDTGEPVGERRVGELTVEGDSVTPGYFGDAGGAPRRRLSTGDLAYEADGHIYVVDRIKDLVIVAGQNYAPSDIETVAAGVVGLRRGRVVAFSAPGRAGTEELHVVAEASPESWRPPAEVADAVRRRVRRGVGLSVASVTIVAPGTLERTSSGKLKRRACADAFHAGTLRPIRSRADVLGYQWALRRDRALVRAAFAARAVLGWVSSARG